MSLTENQFENISVKCTWNVLIDRRIEDTITLSKRGAVNERKSIENIVSLETCVHIGAPPQNPNLPCLLEIKLANEGVKVTHISVVSEARIIEMYGKCGEYLGTSHAEFLDECEDMIVYTTEFQLSQPSSECSLKFARMKDKGQMWLYGVHITTEEEVATSSDSSVNFHNVNKILKESSYQLTDKADKCRKFLQAYNSYWDSSNAQTPTNTHTLVKMLDAVYSNQRSSIGSQTKSVTKCLADLLPMLGSSSKEKVENGCDKSSTVTEKDLPSSESEQWMKYATEELKHHIDRRFSELAVTLTLQIDDKLNEFHRQQNEKLEKLIGLIGNLKEV